ncbi:MAG: hypothetical protein IVW55_18120 [Chloroflexi bacterium]|nr:hypothetical protein [Chloroflexota bacterium]
MTTTYIPSTQTAVVPAASTDLGDPLALHLGHNIDFATTSAFAPEPETSQHFLSWFKGLNATKSATGKALPNYRGWAIQWPEPGDGEDLSLDDESLRVSLESLCEPDEQGVARGAEIIVQHRGDEGSLGKPRIVRYCALARASLFVICRGIPSNGQMRNVETRWGVAVGWQDGKSIVQFQCFVKELMDEGYFLPFFCSFKGTITDFVLNALRTQYKVLKLANDLRSRYKPDLPALPFYAYDLPLVVSDAPRSVGKVQAQSIYVPVPVIPQVIDVAYLREHYASTGELEIIEDDDRIGHTVTWSIETSKGFSAEKPTATAAAESTTKTGGDVSTDTPF